MRNTIVGAMLVVFTIMPLVEAVLASKHDGHDRTRRHTYIVFAVAFLAAAVTYRGGLWWIQASMNLDQAMRFPFTTIPLVAAAFHTALLLGIVFFDRLQKWYEPLHK